MQDWSTDQLREVLDDPNQPANRRAAARSWIDACSTGYTMAGNPVAGNDLDRIIEHTAGKAVQTINQHSDVKLATTADAFKRLMADPVAFAAAIALADQLESKDVPAEPPSE